MLDMTGSAIETPERSKIYWFFNYIQLRQYAILSAEVSASIQSMEAFIQDAPSSRWAIVRSYSTSRYFDPLVTQLAVQRRLIEVADEDALFRLLAQRRVAGIFPRPWFIARKSACMVWRARCGWLTGSARRRQVRAAWC